MRVTFNQVRDGLTAINTASEQFADAQWQVSTGLRVRQPSDDPVAAQRAINDQASLDEIDAYKSVSDSASSRLVAMDQGCIVTTGPPTEVLEHPDVISAYLGTGTIARDRSSTSTTTPEAAGRPFAADTKGSNQ